MERGDLMPGLEIPGLQETMFAPKSTGLDKAMGLMSKSRSTLASTQPNIPEPGKTVGGGLTSGLAGAGAGAATGAAIGSGLGPAGAIAGGVIGLAGYYLS